MKRRISLFVLLVCFVAVNARMPRKHNDATPQTPPTVLANAVDSASFALGLTFATDIVNNISNFPANIDKQKFLEGFNRVMNGDSIEWSADKAVAYVNNYFTKAQQEKNEQVKIEQRAWLENNARRPEVKTLPSGLQYEVVTEGNGEHPTAASTVKVHYEGKLIDGTVFDSSFARGEPIEFPLNGVIKGWTEGLQLMDIGSEYILYIPYNLGYGERGSGQGVIPPYATLVFRVQLLDIIE